MRSGRRGVLACIAAACLLASLPVVSAAAPRAAGAIAAVDDPGSCTNTWNRGGGSYNASEFAVASNWVQGVAPTSTSVVCFPTGTVLFFTLDVTVGSIDVFAGAELDVNGGTVRFTAPTNLDGIRMMNGARLDGAATMTIAHSEVAGTNVDQFGTISSATGAKLIIDGTLDYPGGNGKVLDLDVENNGTVNLAQGATLQIGSGHVFTNNGTVNAAGATITTTTPSIATFRNLGTVEFVGTGPGPDSNGTRPGLQFDNDGEVKIVSGDVAIMATGTSTGTWTIGAAGSPTCASAPGVAPSPAPTARLFFRPNPSLSFTAGSLTGPGCVTVFGGSIDVADGVGWSAVTDIFGGALTLHGDRTLPQLRLGNGGALGIDDGTATASGSISQTSPTQSMRFRGNGTLNVPAGVQFVHVGGNGLDFGGSLDVNFLGPVDITAGFTVLAGANLVTKGTFNVHPQSTVVVESGATLRNEGTMTVEGGTGDILFGGAVGLDNVGTLRVASGAIDMRAPFAQMQAGTLSGGRIEVADGARWIFFPKLTTLAGALRLEGSAHLDESFQTSLNALRDLASIGATGRLELDGADLNLGDGIANGLTNAGTLSLADALLTVPGAFTQQTGSTFATRIGASDVGAVHAASAALAGHLLVSPTVPGQAPVEDATIIEAPGVTGGFDTFSASDGGQIDMHFPPGIVAVTYSAATALAPAIVTTLTASVTEGTAGGPGAQSVLVGVTNPNPTPLFVTWAGVGTTAVVGSVAGPGVDAEVPPGSFELVPGPNVVSVPFLVQQDALAEPDETFVLSWTPGGPTTTVTIVDDDDPPPVLTFGESTFTEASGGGSIDVTRNSAKAPLDVDVVSEDGTAIAGQDYSAVVTTLHFATGQLTAPIDLTLIDDGSPESTETFMLSFADDAFTATVTITDDDPIVPTDDPPFTVTLSSFGPYAEDAGEISLNLRLDRTLDVPMTFDLRTLDGTAEAPQDYVAIDNQQITIPAGQTEGPFVHVTINDDTAAYELNDEFFAVVVSRNGIDLDTAGVDIINNDVDAQARFVRQPSDDADDALVRRIVEGDLQNSTLTLFVELTHPISAPTTVTIAAQGFDAEIGDDFTVTPNELVFQPGDGAKAITFTATADTTLEDDEEVVVGLHTDSGALVGRVDDEAQVTIVDDDQDLTLTPSPAVSVAEDGDQVVMTIDADHAPGVAVTIPLSLEAVTATIAGDEADVVAASVPPFVTLAADATSVSFPITLVDDVAPETDEVLRVHFGPPNQGKLVTTEREVTIVDDDPLPFSLSAADVTVFEGSVVRVLVTAQPQNPSEPAGSGTITLPVTVTDGTAHRESDYFPLNGMNGTIELPAGGGSRYAFADTGFNNLYEETESFQVTFGRSQVPGEQVTVTVTILDDDDLPTVTITSNSPYGEDTGEVSLNLRLSTTAGSPLTFHVSTVDGFAEAGSDFEGISRDITIPEGVTEHDFIRITIIDDNDAFEFEQEEFGVEARYGDQIVAFEEVAIIDNDTGAQARFVRQPSDPANGPFVRSIVEGNSGDPTLALSVELLGDPIAEPATVTIIADSAMADGDDFTVTPTELTFQPGDGPKTVTLTVHANAEIEADELLFLALQTDFGNLLGRVDDEADITILDDDDTTPTDDGVAAFENGWNSFLSKLQDWLAQFNLGSADKPPVATSREADHFALPSLDDDLGFPALDPLDHTLGDLCADLIDLGFAVEFVAGGLCGRPAPPNPADVIRAELTKTLADLVKDAGFSGDPLDGTTNGILQSLASSLGLQGNGGWLGDLEVTIVVGVDGGGFYVDGSTALQLTIGGSVEVSGSGTIAGSATAIAGSASADLTITLSPPVSRLRNLAALFVPTLSGSASMDLSFSTGPLALAWSGAWSLNDGDIVVGAQEIGGSLTLPGLDNTNDGGASLGVTGLLTGDTWHLTASGSIGAAYVLGGFSVDDLAFAADIGPGVLGGTGSLVITAPVPGGDRTVLVTIAFDTGQLTIDGQLTLPAFAVGDPPLLALVDPFVHAHFSAALPGGPLEGSVEVGATSATVLPNDPVGTATGLLGTLTSAGALTLHADTAHTAIAGGAMEVDLTGVDFNVGPGTGDVLFSVSSATGTFPALDDLVVTFTGLFLTKAGVFGATSVDVDSGAGLAQSIGLGGVLPFDVTGITVVFPDPSDLNSFEVHAEGRFDFAAFPQIPGFTPRVGLGGPVVTPDSPPEDNHFSFSIDVESLADGIVLPLDVGPITLGFDGLQAGDYTVGADITLGGFVGGVFQTSIGGALTVDGPSGSILDSVEVELDGTITPGETTVADIAGHVVLSGTLGPLTITDMDLRAGVTVSFGPGGLTFEPRLEGFDIGSVAFDFGDLMTLQAADVSLNLNPAPGENILEVGDQGGLTVAFDEGIEILDGWGGTFRNLAIGSDFVPKLLPNFGFDLTVPEDMQFGLPEFIPLRLDAVGITFPDIVTAPPEGIALTPDLLAGLRIRISGGLDTTPTWPIGAAVDGLEIDLGKLVNGQFPITNLDGISFGVEPFELPGGVVIGGGLTLGTIDVDGTTVFYGRIFGEFSVADIGGGADLVVTQYGPVLLKVHAPLGIPLGPTGIVLAGVEGAAQFGAVGIPVPPTGNPTALLNNFTLPTDLTITDEVIRDAVAPVVNAETPEFTWDEGFALSLAGDLIVAAAPGVLKGRATIGMNLGLPDGPNDPPGLQLVGKGEVTAFGIPLGEVGLLIDLANPIEPKFDLAFASPVPGSPLSLVFPAQATFGVQLRTDGVVLGTIEGLRTFTQQVVDGSIAAGGDLFQAVLAEIAAQLEANHSRPLAALLLDVDGNGSVSQAEGSRVITGAFLTDRMLGRNGLPALLPATVSNTTLEAAAHAATAIFNELLLVAGDVIEHPETFGSFLVDAGAAGDGFDGLVGQAGEALAALAGVIRDATSDALQEFGDRFNPSFTIEGALQPTFMGLPLGAPAVGGRLFIDRQGLFFEMSGSLTEIGQVVVGQSFPLVAGAIDAAMTAATLGLSDQISVGARLPFGGIIDSLIGGSNLPTFQPLDPNWAVTFTGAISILGYEGAELSGMAFLPGQQTFLETRIQKLYELPPGTPVDATRIPITTQQHFDALVQYGGILLTASLRVPRLVTNPAAQLAVLPPPPENPLEYLEWLNDVAALATQTDTPARVQFFMPGIATVASDAAATQWASTPYVEGVWDGDLLGLDLGRATMNLTPNGLDVTGQFPLVGLTGTVTLNSALLDGGSRLPSAGLDLTLDNSSIAPTLARIGIPSVFVPPVDATAHLRAFTPGFDPDSSELIERNGGLQFDATLGTQGIFGAVQFTFALIPNGTGFDVHGGAVAPSIGPIAGTTITNAAINVDIVNGQVSVHVAGNANVLGATATVEGTLAADLTGKLTFTFQSGEMSLAGTSITGSATLSLTRVGGQLRGSLGITGTATLPAWLATAAGSSKLTVTACVDTVGNAELAVSMPTMQFGPNGLVRIGRNPNQVALPASPAACSLPTGAPSQNATGPLVRLRVANGAGSMVLDGSLVFVASGASVAGLSVTGSFNTATGKANLAVAFNGGAISLSGFSIQGSATATFAPGSFSMSVNGSMSVTGLFSGATISGTATEAGITHLSVGVASLSLPPLTVSSFSLSLDRTKPSVYTLAVGGTVSYAGLGTMTVNGTASTNGNFSLGISGTALTIAGAGITQGSFSITRTGGSTTLSASGRFSLFGNSLEVVQASLTLSSPPAISGSLVIRPVGGGTLTLGGWAIGGTLKINFSGTTSSISVDNGTITIPGWGTVGITAAISVPVQNGSFFQLSLPSGGLRLGAAGSPFVATGTFRLSFNSNVATLSATNAGVSWKDGSTVVASVVAPALTVSSNGSASVTLNSFSASAGGFSFTVPSLSLLIDTQGLNARLSLGAGSFTIPGLPALTTPAFTIGTSPSFSVVLSAGELDLGLIVLHGKLVFERQGGVFRLKFDAPGSLQAAGVEIEGLVDIPLPSFTVASNGTFTIDGVVPAFGPDGFRITGAAIHLAKTGADISTLAGQITAGKLLIGNTDPINLPTLDFDHDSRFDETFHISAWDLGPFLKTTSIDFRVRQLSTGVMRLTLENDPSVTMFAGSTSLLFTSLTVETDGTFTGSITGRLALFGFRLGQATFNVTKDGNVVKLTLPSSSAVNLNLGFLSASMHGFATSEGRFDFSGSTSVSLGVTGFSFSGTTSVHVTSFDGIEGSFSGRVCIVACATTGGSLRSDGRIKGFLQVDLNGDGDFNDFGEVNADWRVYLATGGVRVDLNRDGDWDDFGDIVIGSTTSEDTTDPDMSSPPNITVNANIGASGTVRVYYTNPTATDNGQALTVTCTPASGSSFAVGATEVTCKAVDEANNTRTRTFTITVIANEAATVPTATNGATVIVEASGFLPNSLVFVRFQSETVYIGVFQADENGNVLLDLTVPDNLPPGTHDIIVEGTGMKGGVWQYVQPLVVGDGTSPGGEPAPEPPPMIPLPVTGGDGGALPILPIGAAAIAIGALLLIVRNRRSDLVCKGR